MHSDLLLTTNHLPVYQVFRSFQRSKHTMSTIC